MKEKSFGEFLRNSTGMRLICLFLLCLAGICNGTANGTTITSPVTYTEDTQWEGRIEIKADVIVEKGAKLTILPGTEVIFSSDGAKQYGLINRGELAAIGKKEAQIKISSDKKGANRGYILSETGSSTKLEYCEISYLGRDGTPEEKKESDSIKRRGVCAYKVDGSQGSQLFEIKHCHIHNGFEGIIVFGSKKVAITENTIQNNIQGGVLVLEYSDRVSIAGNKIYNNSIGVLINLSRNCIINKNDITGNREQGIYFMWAVTSKADGNVVYRNGHGIGLFGASGNIINKNTICNNSGHGIYLSADSNENTIMNCIVANNRLYGIGILDKDGKSQPKDSYNCLWNNTQGDYSNRKPPEGGKGSIVKDPLFVKAEDDNFNLKDSSPCIDSGFPKRADMGAYETGKIPVKIYGMGIITNPGFEKAKDGVPEGWTFPESVLPVLDKEVKFEGAQSLKLTAKIKDYEAVGVKQTVTVKPNTGYVLSCRIKLDGDNSAMVGFSVEGLNAWPNQWLAGKTNWKRLECQFRTGEEQDKVTINLFAYTAPCWVDDFQLKEDDSVKMGDITPVVGEMPPVSEKASKLGYVVFTKNYFERVYYTTIPKKEEITDKLELSATPGEYEPVIFMVRALKNLKGVKITAGDLKGKTGELIEKSNIKIDVVKSLKRQVTTNQYEMVPVYLANEKNTNIPKDTTQQFWVTIKVPEGSAPGKYQGQMNITPEGGEGSSLNLEVEVLPFKLVSPPVAFGMYYTQAIYFYYATPELSKIINTPEYVTKCLQDMKEHGMTSVAIYADPEFSDEYKNITVDFTRTYIEGKLPMETMMECLEKVGLVPDNVPLPFISHGTRGGWGSFGDRKTIGLIEKERKNRKWPELLYYFEDEPNLPDRIESARRTYKTLYEGTPVRTVTAIGETGIKAVGDLYDVWITSVTEIHKTASIAKEKNKEVWGYDCVLNGLSPVADRFMYGLFSWKTGANGMWQWEYGKPVVFIEDDESVTGDIFLALGYVIYTRNGPIPTIGWEGKREGIDDYKYLLTLEETIDKCKKNKNSAQMENKVKEAEALLQKINEKIDLVSYSKRYIAHGAALDYRLDNVPLENLTSDDYNKIRGEVAKQIIELNKVLNSKK